MNQKKTWKVAILLILSILLLAGCGGKGDDGKSKEKTLVYGSGDYTSINPAIKEHGEINSLIFTGLMKHDLENNVETDLAKEVTCSQDHLTYSFTLRDDATFHDGKPVTAEDVEFTLQTILNPDNGSEIVSNYEDIAEMKVSDKANISITLKAPNVALYDHWYFTKTFTGRQRYHHP
ncbi:MAG: ABC transporter substrate-binding protein [Anaerovorax sp.]